MTGNGPEIDNRAKTVLRVTATIIVTLPNRRYCCCWIAIIASGSRVVFCERAANKTKTKKKNDGFDRALYYNNRVRADQLATWWAHIFFSPDRTHSLRGVAHYFQLNATAVGPSARSSSSRSPSNPRTNSAAAAVDKFGVVTKRRCIVSRGNWRDAETK